MRHLQYDDRIKIEILSKENYSTHEIAERLGFSERTIRNELKRGHYENYGQYLYSADIAQADYNFKATAKGAKIKLEKDYRFVQFCESCILKLQWSPDTIIGFIRKRKLHFQCNVCTKTLYNYIDCGYLLNVTNKNLPVKSTRKQKVIKKVHRIKKPLQRCISERDKQILSRSDFGHWEMDTVIGKRNEKACLLVLTERQTRFEIVMKIKEKSLFAVSRALNRLERCNKDFSNIFKTITVDNGSEFINPVYLEKSCRHKGKRTEVYYCHPYSSAERGSNENANKLIRRFIPKGQSMLAVTALDVRNIQNWINNLPRKIHDYKTALQLLQCTINV